MTGLTGLPATCEQEAGTSAPEITAPFSIKACWHGRGRGKLLFPPTPFARLEVISEICISGSFNLRVFWALLGITFLSAFLGLGLEPPAEP